MSTAVSVSDVGMSYETVTALQGVSFDVERGELFGLIGPDGAGKSTLFRILATLLLAETGSVTIHGLDVVQDYKKLRKTIGYMPGRFSLYPDLTVRENLEFYATIFGTTIEANYSVIKDIYDQISPFDTRRAGKLSGGMKQKLALCCSLVHNPSLLLLDEPTTGVDPVSRREFWDILDDLKGRGMTILVSTAYMDEASRCDRVVLMQKGNVLGIDTPAAIVTRMDRSLWQAKSDHMHRLIGDLRSYEEIDLVYPFGEVVHFFTRDEDLDVGALTADLRAAGHSEISIDSASPTTEDVFISLMQEVA